MKEAIRGRALTSGKQLYPFDIMDGYEAEMKEVDLAKPRERVNSYWNMFINNKSGVVAKEKSWHTSLNGRGWTNKKT